MAHEKYAHCIDSCNRCADACDHCSTACLKEPNVAAMARCVGLDIDCAALCRFAAGAMSRNSEFAATICNLCAEVCEACGEECDKHEHDHCKECARLCRECAQACREMAA